jgi:hypothetical protein
MLFFYMVGRKLDSVWLRRMPLAMIPYMLSGLCAIIYHVSADEWTGFNTAQSYLTFTGSCCFALWAFLFLRDLTEKKSRAQLSPTEMGKGDLMGKSRAQLSPTEFNGKGKKEEVRHG